MLSRTSKALFEPQVKIHFSILVAQMSEVEFRYPNPNWYKVCDKIAILFAKMWLLQGERGRPWRWNTNVATSALR